MKLKTLCLAVALVSAAPSALAQEGPDPNGAVIVGEAPDCATGVIRSVIVGVGTLCADGTVGPGNAPGLLDGATVVGTDNTVDSYSTVFGRNNSNSKGAFGGSGTFSTQVGMENSIDGILTNQFGNKNQSTGANNHQFGHENITNGEGSSSQFGWSNEAFGTQNVQLGNHNSANGNYNTQAGTDNRVIDGYSNSMLGLGNELNGSQNHVHGNINTVEGQLNSVSGTQNSVSGSRNVVDGMDVQVSANRVVAGGVSIRATADDCVAFGSYSECDESDEFSVGGAAIQRRVVNMGDGRDANDAVNVGQVAPIADSFGGGAGFANGQFVAPNYGFRDGTNHSNVGSAVDNLDARVWNLENNSGGGGQGPEGPQGIQGADGRSAYEVAVANGFEGNEQKWLESLQGRDGRDGTGGGSDVAAGRNVEVEDNADGTRSVHLSDMVELSENGGVRIEGGPSMTRQGIDAGNQRVTGVAAGRIERGSTDAVNGGQLWDMERRFDDRWTEVNNRLQRTDERIDILGAQSAALTMMAAAGSPHGLQVGEVAFNVAPGFYGNKAALAVGYSSRLSERVSVSAGLSVASGGRAMGGVGFSFRLGR
ncbi:YadA-like family protein [Luteimonas dalianensis]|uniref:YadA-like family protein n=1 Tax=Luteimonas dalianensis TaxID=1148196 RepID=UPI003BF06BF0